ncbi:hypothetical protein [Ilyobacter polytropus]|uniref:hypothetical protein n=1 Tax=Ilyobacter polytropus TaxID=167642 RepID=UPI00030E6764|nr:hypothetical protein [Ilyobacter polytropus]
MKELSYEMTNDVTSEPTTSNRLILKDYDRSFMATKDEVFENLGKTILVDVRTKKN